jgi:phosphatidylethanolamine-binding protein (PEBP) family uncharacterized protein
MRVLALIVVDPDAPVGTFAHLLARNIDPQAGGLREGESARSSPAREGASALTSAPRLIDSFRTRRAFH